MFKEDLADEFPASAHARLIEDRLQVVLHGERRDGEPVQSLWWRGPWLSRLSPWIWWAGVGWS